MEPKESIVPGAIKGTAEAVTGLLKEVPIYQDLAQPAVQEVGSALRDAVRTALAPLRAFIWGFDKISDYLEQAIEQRLAKLSPDQIVTPNPMVAGPAIEALRFAGHEPILREMYANLLATAMDANRVRDAHPAFVEIIRQLTPDEARIVTLAATRDLFPLITIEAWNREDLLDPRRPVIKHLGLMCDECQFPEFFASYVDNVCRLGLALIQDGVYTPRFEEEYDRLRAHQIVTSAMGQLSGTNLEPTYDYQLLHVTTFGKQFARACIG